MILAAAALAHPFAASPALASGMGAMASGATTQAAEPRLPGSTIRVGVAGDVQTIAQAARRARDGDTIEVEAGEYRGDVAVWRQRRLTIRAVGGRARLIADGKSAEGKGIWVIRNGEFLVEGFDFEGARVPGRNGAGIRFEHGRLTVRDARFIGNETGILTGNDGRSELVIERCLFADNGHGDGQSHNLYVGKIERLVVRASHFRGARVGHLLKSRARISDVRYNRFTDEEGGRASYELEFPSGGLVTAIGNLVEQAATTLNSTIVSYGAEGYGWPENVLVFVHNTVVNRRLWGGIFIRAHPGPARVVSANNVFSGTGVMRIDVPAETLGNVDASPAQFVDPERYDFRPAAEAPFAQQAVRLDGEWAAYRPEHEYRHERQLAPREERARPTPGAFAPPH